MNNIDVKQLKRHNQLNELYIVRALAMIGVIVVHVSSIPLGQVDAHSRMYLGYHILNIFNRYGTTTFIFLSAFVLFYNYYGRPINRKLIQTFYQRRLLYIVVPYLIWSAVYYAIQSEYGFGWANASLTDFVSMLWTGKAFYHLYFIAINIQFYLFFPFILWLLQRKPRLTHHLIWIGFVLQYAFLIYHYKYAPNTDKSGFMLSYISNYFLGAYCGLYYNSIKKWLTAAADKAFKHNFLRWTPLWAAWLAAGYGNIYIWFEHRANGQPLSDWGNEIFWNIHTIASALVLLQISLWMYEKWNSSAVNLLIRLGVVSFGVYIIHAAIMFYYFRWVDGSSSPLFYHVYIGGGFAVTLLGSALITAFVSKYFKLAWVLFGSGPKSNPYRTAPPKFNSELRKEASFN